MSNILKPFSGAWSLLSGMALTFSYLINPKKVVTQQYPENRGELVLAERFRAQVIMPHDAEGEHRCTGCKKCEKACPNGTISIHLTKDMAGKRVLGQFVYRLSQCTLCNLCIESCPFDSIRMGADFELAQYTRKPLDLILNNKIGR